MSVHPYVLGTAALLPAARSAVASVADGTASFLGALQRAVTTASPPAQAADGPAQQSDRGVHRPGVLGDRPQDVQRLLETLLRTADGPIRVEDLQQHVDTAQRRFSEQLADELQLAGIDVSAPITLEVRAEDGRIVLPADHPNREAIERLFEDRPELADQFRQLTAAQRLLSAATQDPAFADWLAEDPYRALGISSESRERQAGPLVMRRV